MGTKVAAEGRRDEKVETHDPAQSELLIAVVFEFFGVRWLLVIGFQGRRVVVLGLGATGWSMTRWLTRHGAEVSVLDTRSDPPRALDLRRELPGVGLECGEYRDASLRRADLIAISPGVDPRAPVIAAALERGVPLLGDVELFALARTQLPSLRLAPPKVLAITGTNGKSTVTKMAGDICAAAGLPIVVAGNIGTPVLDTLLDIEDGKPAPAVFVLELSSFQLEATATLNADAATVLNVSEDHLDRYDSVNAYAAVKQRVFAGDGIQILNRDDVRSAAMALPGRQIQRFGLDAPGADSEWGIVAHGSEAWLMRGADALMPVAQLPVEGLQNAANALAAAALARSIGVDDAATVRALREFKGLPHRIEKITTYNGISFYDDSKGTNVGATLAALSGFATPVVLIAGGEGKNQDFTALRATVGKHARAVVLIGRDREQIAAALEGGAVDLIHAPDMEHAVAAAYAAAQRGDVVLLSPACASFDMFKNYAQRGDAFAQAVMKLTTR